jgi:hypothetical protein
MSLVADPISAAMAKHIDIIYHHVKQRVQMQQMHFVGIQQEFIPHMCSQASPRNTVYEAQAFSWDSSIALGYIHSFEDRES